MKSIWIILRSSIHKRRPIMSVLRNLLDLGFTVNLVSIESSKIEHPNIREYIYDIGTGKSMISTLVCYIKLRQFVDKILNNYVKEDDIIWLGSLDTINLCTGLQVFKEVTYICHISELYDQHKHRLFLSKKFIQNSSKVIVPELNRARILRVWLGLDKLPIIYPNKPWNHPRKRNLPPTTKITKEILDNHDTSKDIIVYQGHIGKDRSLEPIVKAIKELDNVEFWLMGENHDNYVEELLKITDKVKYLGFVPAPYHLEITSYCKIGVMSYNLSSLNNLYCAPNKVWEYLGFNIFFICNEVGSLDNLVELGCCKNIDFNNISDLKKVISSELKNTHEFTDIYDSVDLKEIILNILN